MKKLLVLLLISLAVAIVWTHVANAAYGDPRLNVVASSVAGHGVVVSCGSGSTDWATTEHTQGLTFETDGFTFIGRNNIIYLAPRVCDTLEALLDPAAHDSLGTYWPALAIKTIIHESVHQSGVKDESATDCTALSLVKQYAVSSFGFPVSIKKQVIVKRVVKTIVVPNPALASLVLWATAWHRTLPINYQGVC